MYTYMYEYVQTHIHKFMHVYFYQHGYKLLKELSKHNKESGSIVTKITSR